MTVDLANTAATAALGVETHTYSAAVADAMAKNAALARAAFSADLAKLDAGTLFAADASMADVVKVLRGYIAAAYQMADAMVDTATTAKTANESAARILAVNAELAMNVAMNERRPTAAAPVALAVNSNRVN